MNDDLDVLVRNLMGAIFDCNPNTIGPGSSMESIEAWDSLQHLHLVLDLEEKLAVQFTADEIVNMGSFDQIIVATKRALSNSPPTKSADKPIESKDS